jgi:tetratricopeptide (TPR) repeat protein
MKTTMVPGLAFALRFNSWLGGFLFLALLSSTCFAADEKAASELAAYKELSQTRLEATRDLLQKDVQALSGRLDMQDKRLDSQNAHIDQNLSLLQTLLTVLGVVLGLAGVAGYVSVQRKARKEAQAASASWFRQHAKELDETINSLQLRVLEVEERATSAITAINEHAQGVQNSADKAIQTIQQGMADPSKPFMNIPPEDAEALMQLARSLKEKPEATYTFKDWDNRAFAAYNAGDREGAARFWREAASSENLQPVDGAMALFNAGVALGALDRREQEIAVYDELIDRFGASDETGVRDVVAKTLLNKGFRLGQQGRHGEEIAVYDVLIHRFGAATEAALREQVAKALVNKGSRLGALQRVEEAIAVYDEVIRRYGEASETALREQVAMAKNGKGFALLCRGKQRWQEEENRQDDLRQADTLFLQALERDTEKSIVLGNQAYCAHLLGRYEGEVREKLTKALKEGGKELYDATLRDLVIHTAPPDTAFRALLDEVWQEVGTQAT